MIRILNEEQLLKILQGINSSIVPTEERYSRYDCESDKAIIELKCRRKAYSTYIIEKPKYEALIKIAVEKGKVPLYVNSTPDGIYIWDLSKLKLEFEDKMLRQSTYFSNNRYIKKQIAYLSTSDANKLPYNDAEGV